jgi:hypothetical protein
MGATGSVSEPVRAGRRESHGFEDEPVAPSPPFPQIEERIGPGSCRVIPLQDSDGSPTMLV